MVRIPVTFADLNSGRIKNSISKLSKHHPDQPLKPKRSMMQQTLAQILGYGGYEELRSFAKKNGPSYSGQPLAIDQAIASISLRIARYWSVSADKAELVAAALGLIHLDAFRTTARPVQQPLLREHRVNPPGHWTDIPVSLKRLLNAVHQATVKPMAQMAAIHDAMKPMAQMAAIHDAMKPMAQMAAIHDAMKPMAQMAAIHDALKPSAQMAAIHDALKPSAQMAAIHDAMKPMAQMAAIHDALKPSAQMAAIHDAMKPMAQMAAIHDAMNSSAQMAVIRDAMKPMAHMAAIQDALKPLGQIATILDALKSRSIYVKQAQSDLQEEL
jgi:D-alanyl-D-alanine dipeptidase